MILLEHNWYLNLQLDRNMNSPLIAHFRFPNIVMRKKKSKKEKMQCSQNIELNPTHAMGIPGCTDGVLCRGIPGCTDDVLCRGIPGCTDDVRCSYRCPWVY